MRPSLVALLCLAGLVPPATLSGQEQIRWTRSAAPDGSFSLQQPEGWTARFGASNVRLGHAAGDEEIIVIRLPRDPSKSASVYAETVTRSFQQALAGFQMSNLTPGRDSAAFLVTYKSDGKTWLGPGAVVLKPGAAWWVSYGSPSAAALARGAALITGVAGSLVDGAGTPAQVPPSPPVSSSLAGTWGTTGYFGELVNPANGAFLQSSYSGEWYDFSADGTYRYTIAGSGQIITGVAISAGTYEVAGNTVKLHQKTESWYPMPRDATRRPMFKDRPTPEEITLTIEPKGPAEMVIRRGTDAGTFHRDPKSK